MRKWLSFLLLAFCSYAHAENAENWKEEVFSSLSMKERSILEVFFRTLCTDSQAGYVIWGNKPISEEGIVPEETPLLMLDNPLHRMSIYAKEGLKIWHKLKCSQKSKNYHIVSYQKPTHSWLTFAVINKKAFIQTIEKNLSLFQYVLGPKVTGESLFEKSIDPSLNFFGDVLKDDKVLIGIVLGFGTQNALIENRIEMISEQQMLEAFPPFKPEIKKGDAFGGISHKLNRKVVKELAPSFGYSSLKNEVEDLEKKTQITVEVYRSAMPPLPWFGFIANSESEELLKHYLDVQPNIKSALDSDQFLEIFLTKFFGEG